MVMEPRAYIDMLGEDGGAVSVTSGDPSKVRVHLELHYGPYGEKRASIEIPGGTVAQAGESGAEAHRRSLQEVMDALNKVAATKDGILWPMRR